MFFLLHYRFIYRHMTKPFFIDEYLYTRQRCKMQTMWKFALNCILVYVCYALDYWVRFDDNINTATNENVVVMLLTVKTIMAVNDSNNSSNNLAHITLSLFLNAFSLKIRYLTSCTLKHKLIYCVQYETCVKLMHEITFNGARTRTAIKNVN